MRASVLAKRDGRTVIETQTLANLRPQADQVVLEVRAAALNHLDLYAVAHHREAASAASKIIGSDAAGIVAVVGDAVEDLSPGEAVVLDPGLSCGHCEWCRTGEDSLCNEFDIVGRGVPGTLCEQVVVPARNLFPKPEHLDFEEAAALCLDHLTAWRMVQTRGRLQPEESVLIHGIGGGAAQAALQIAKSVKGTKVMVTSSSDAKLERARALGADAAVNYRARPDVAAEARRWTEGRGVDLVIDSVGAATLAASVAAATNGGRVVVCGATTGADAEVDLRQVFWRQISIIGSTMGSLAEFGQMLAAVTESRWKPVVDSVWHLSELEPALGRLAAAEQFGKIVLSTRGGSGRWP